MPNLTSEGARGVAEIAARHGFSADAASSLLDSLLRGQGAQAQFNHPEFGGFGQWSRGGMIMIGDMFNNGLKARVDALCNDLSDLIARQPGLQAPAPAPSFPSQSQSQSQGGGGSWFSGSSSAWPEALGAPSSSGAQNDMAYAFFPATRRLAIRQGGQTRIYDTGDHQFSGFSQQQGGGQSLSFNSQRGTVRVADLPLTTEDRPAAPAPAAPLRPAPAPPDTWAAPAPPREVPKPSADKPGADEILKTIKSLAALRQEGILTEDEFAAKKAELLSRL